MMCPFLEITDDEKRLTEAGLYSLIHIVDVLWWR